MKKLEKIASQDAFRWARAEMFFGDGAGTRRRLVEAEISQKMKDIPGYKDAFMTWYEKQDMAEHAIAAAKERQKIDRSIRVHRNTRALVPTMPASFRAGPQTPRTLFPDTNMGSKSTRSRPRR